MRFNKLNPATEQNLSWLRFFHLFVVMLAFALGSMFSMTAEAQSGRGHKLSADLANFPLNSDGTVSVIIQFNQTPKAQHFADLAARGGKLKFSLEHINGAAYRIPVRVLAWLENHPDVAYVSPDRPNKVAWDSGSSTSDDDIPAVMDDV